MCSTSEEEEREEVKGDGLEGSRDKENNNGPKSVEVGG